jgi:hypothetical protein
LLKAGNLVNFRVKRLFIVADRLLTLAGGKTDGGYFSVE